MLAFSARNMPPCITHWVMEVCKPSHHVVVRSHCDLAKVYWSSFCISPLVSSFICSVVLPFAQSLEFIIYSASTGCTFSLTCQAVGQVTRCLSEFGALSWGLGSLRSRVAFGLLVSRCRSCLCEQQIGLSVFGTTREATSTSMELPVSTVHATSHCNDEYGCDEYYCCSSHHLHC